MVPKESMQPSGDGSHAIPSMDRIRKTLRSSPLVTDVTIDTVRRRICDTYNSRNGSKRVEKRLEAQIFLYTRDARCLLHETSSTDFLGEMHN